MSSFLQRLKAFILDLPKPFPPPDQLISSGSGLSSINVAKAISPSAKPLSTRADLPWERGILGKSSIGSNTFFYIILGVFLFQAIWIALSGLYPMAFDERTHYGLIRLYSERLLPFWSEQPPGASIYGAVVRDPSYLYHYLLSFPYRLIAIFIKTETSQVLFLRGISIVLVGTGIVMYRRVLIYSRASKAIINCLMAIFVMTPVVPFLAAQVNYDSLVFLITPCVILLALQISEQLKKQWVSVPKIAIFFSLIVLGSLVKYAFLPIAFTTFCFVIFRIYKYISESGAASLRETLRAMNVGVKVAIVLLLVVCLGLFLERYGVNTKNYRTPTPECDQVLSVKNCMDYSPWRRNYLTHQDKIAGTLEEVFPTSIPWYVYNRWAPWITDSMFEVFNGEASGYVIGPSLPVSALFYQSLAVAGAISIIWRFKLLRSKYQLGLFAALILILALSLFIQNYMDFLRLGYPYAIQGRYLLPVLPLIYLILFLAVNLSLNKVRSFKVLIAAGGMIIFLTQSSGLITYITRSDHTWYWPNRIVISVNEKAKEIIRPIVLQDE